MAVPERSSRNAPRGENSSERAVPTAGTRWPARGRDRPGGRQPRHHPQHSRRAGRHAVLLHLGFHHHPDAAERGLRSLAHAAVLRASLLSPGAGADRLRRDLVPGDGLVGHAAAARRCVGGAVLLRELPRLLGRCPGSGAVAAGHHLVARRRGALLCAVPVAASARAQAHGPAPARAVPGDRRCVEPDPDTRIYLRSAACPTSCRADGCAGCRPRSRWRRRWPRSR